MAEPGYRGWAGASFSCCRRNLMLPTTDRSRPTRCYWTQCSSERSGRRTQQRAACLPLRNVDVHSHNQRPSRRRRWPTPPRPATAAHVFTFLIICLLLPGVLADSRFDAEDHPRVRTRRRSSDTTLAARSKPSDDRAEPPAQPARMRLVLRQFQDAETTVTVPELTTTTASSRSRERTTTTVTSTSSLAAATSPLSGGSLPKPFDTNLGNNFTATCLPFFQSMLGDEGFNECEPFSLLLQNSQGFFQAEKSLVSVTQVLDASCAANFDRCNGLMSDYAIQLRDQKNCGTDFDQSNPVVAQAFYGLISYQTMYQAGCLKDSSGSYCFADAVTNSSSISDTYPYYLPLHMDLPGGARPTCNACLQRTMQVFANAATNGSQPVSSTYLNAAQQINIACGPGFVSSSVQVTTGAAAASVVAGGGLAPLLALGAVLFQLVA